jgi:nucleoside permease NupC
MRTSIGLACFQVAGEAVSNFLSFSAYGSEFVFGTFPDSFHFAFDVLPATIFFSAFISMLYYVGVLQVVVRIIAMSLNYLMGSTIVQSVNAAGNLFLGQSEVPLLIKPLLRTCSACDLHCIMVGGMASVSGSVLAAYIAMGINAEQLIGASVMSVPGTLMISNLVCPPGTILRATDCCDGEACMESTELAEAGGISHGGECGQGEQLGDIDGDGDTNSLQFEFPPPSEGNIVEAIGNGAHIAIDLVLNIGAALIAFISMLAFMDAVLSYLGGLVDVPELCFTLITGYLFWPIAWLLGTPSADCFEVAKLIGTKIFLNEFVAYSQLSGLLDIDDRRLSPRAELTATYALCGFSNFGSIGIMIGCLSSLSSEQAKPAAKLAVSAMLSANVVCFVTAAIAGILN